MIEKINEILLWAWLLFLCSVFISGVLFLIFERQETTLSTDATCDKIRDCVLLEIKCVNRHMYHKFFFWEWGTDDKAFYTQQKQHYEENCFNDAKEVQDE